MILEHEYGDFYGSYKCLCIDSFSGHWRRRLMKDVYKINISEIVD